MSATSSGAAEDLGRRIEAIESGYEFLLAYAAQGRETDRGHGAGRTVREHLAAMQEALDGLAAVIGRRGEARGVADVAGPFFAAVERDAEVARSALQLVLAQTDISSQLIDNLNASIHVRALLTDLFVVDEALKERKQST